ncbi:TonB-dependent receptor [Leptobacterium flavescens]|uniref:TonB-dependent receptor n=1 Tax=Leptobacterium flavescens TaxID=472055 RepID=A0A6P0UX33_9FLAO|nr:TonB-dependent receptor [Leptobacterium flavescens]NER15293.1 TonB-dependent receptor [Leptobacterium flavescens]
MYRRFGQIIFFVLIPLTSVWAQDKKEDEKKNIGTEVVNVVKSYTPTISDAFKVKQTPKLNDSVTTRKKKVKYSIFSVPVASTFVPAKGKATGVKKAKREVLYDSYVSVGLGNFTNALVDFYTSRALNRDETLDISFNHHSSQGGIDGVVLDDNFFNTRLEGAYKKRTRDLNWGLEGGAQHQAYNWYGLPEQITFDQPTLDGIDEKQSYLTGFVKADLEIKDSYFKNGEALIRGFFDGESSSEFRAYIKPTFEIPIADELITTNFAIDYLKGGFDRSFFNADQELNYSSLILGVTPNLVILRDDLTVNLGATIVYALDPENSDNDFFIYPNVTASYRLVDEYVIAYGGIEGKLVQNTYHGFVEDNQFVSPTLNVTPTDQQYDAYVGVKGRLHSNVGYNLRGSFKAENNKALYRLNPVNFFSDPQSGFAYGNSFDIVYDDVKTISVFGELNINVNRNFTLGINAEVFEYTSDDEQEAWNLPTIKGSLFGDYQIDEHWFLGANIFYVGEREDLFTPDNLGDPLAVVPTQQVTLDSYFDVNAHAGYRFGDQLTAFVKANNISGNEYARWANYRVQGFQVLAGATYKFDF